MATLKDLIINNRSYRRYNENIKVSIDTLKGLIDLARISPCSRNIQSLKYRIVNSSDELELLYPLVMWAGYIKDWNGPEKGQRPSAFIIQLNDKTITSNYLCDDGIAAQSILLGAVELDLGGCILGSIDKEKTKFALNIPSHLEVIQAIAIGKPDEKVVVVPMVNNDVKYWRDENQIHHVPKRSLDEIILLE